MPSRLGCLFKRVCLPACRVNVILCDKACAVCAEETSLHTDISLFFWHPWDDRTKIASFLTGRCYKSIKKIFSLPFTFYNIAQPKIIVCVPLYKAQQQWQKSFCLWISSPSPMFAGPSGKPLWVQGSVCILPIPHCLCSLALWRSFPSSLPTEQFI